MKNRLLFVLPLLMVLSSCSNINNPIINKINNVLEDTNIHQKLFDDNYESFDFGIKKPLSLKEDLVEPTIGVQFKSYNQDDNDYYAIRYVAAIKGLDVTATWTRAVSDLNGNETKALDSFPVTKAYKSLNNGGVISTASIEYPGYEYYVVYTMYDIPATSINEKLYMMAYLTLSYEDEKLVKSKAVVAQIGGKGHVFSFDVDSVTNDYFIDVKHNEGEDTIYYGEIGEDKPDPDKAVFINTLFANNDNFGLFKYDGTSFKFCSYSTYLGSTASRFSKLVGTKDYYGQLYLSGSYSLYVNHQDKVYISPTDVLTTISFTPNSNWKQDGDGHAPRFAIYAFGGSAGEEWFDLERKGATDIYKLDNFNIGTHTTVIFCRMNGNDSNLDNNWSNKYNQTGNLIINSDETGPTNVTLMKYVLGDSQWDGNYGSWQRA